MSDNESQPSRAPSAATIRNALRDVSRGDPLRVATTDAGERRGWFKSFDGEALVLSLTPAGDRTALIAVATIRGIVRTHHSAAQGGAIAALLAAVPVFLVARMFIDSRDPHLGGILLLVGVPGLVVIGLAAGVGAVVGLAFDRREPLFQAAPAR